MSETNAKAIREATALVVTSYISGSARPLPAGLDLGALMQDVAKAFAGTYVKPPEAPHPLNYLATNQRKRKYKPRAPKSIPVYVPPAEAAPVVRDVISIAGTGTETPRKNLSEGSILAGTIEEPGAPDDSHAPGNVSANNGSTKAGGWKKLT